MLSFGDWKIRSVVNGHFRLDGGAMFGVVPKVMWAKTQEVDAQNRILMAMRTLLAVNQAASRVMVVDTGAGTKWTKEAADRYAIETDPNAIDAALSEIGAHRVAVTDVVVTHLHFDHGGGMTEWVGEQGGDLQPCYPNAQHWIHQRQLLHAQKPSRRDQASYHTIDFDPLIKGELLTIVDGDPPPSVIPGVEWWVSDGHTPGQLLPHFRTLGDEPELLFVGDVIPTAAHLPATWVMGYDLYPLTTLAEREKVHHHCRQDGLRLAFPHDASRGVVSVLFDEKGRPSVGEVLG